MKQLSFLLLFIFFSTTGFSQFFDDTKSKEFAQKGLDLLYNQKFEDAAYVFQNVKNKYPNHPVNFLINALELELRYLPIDKNPTKLKEYLAELDKCIAAGKNLHRNPTYKKEATFFILAAYGFSALTHNYRNDFMAAADEARKALSYFLDSKKYKNDNPEFYFPSGLYNYYRVQYPEDHPIVKPVMIFFEQGNKKTGLLELETAIKRSIFCKTESTMYLTNIYINYESNFTKAKYYSELLFDKYPDNQIFKLKYIECLLLNKEYEKANQLNQTLKNNTKNIFAISYNCFEGYLQEHYLKNNSLALSHYAKALKFPKEERYTKEYRSIASLGLARIMRDQNEYDKAKVFYKDALKNTDYVWIKNSASIELKALKN